MAKSRPIDLKGQKGFKMLVLNEVDRLSPHAQHSLRRTMEKYSAGCRLVLCCNNVSKVCTCCLWQSLDLLPHHQAADQLEITWPTCYMWKLGSSAASHPPSMLLVVVLVEQACQEGQFSR